SFVSAVVKADGTAPDWRALAAVNHTVAVYMGVGAAARVQDGLIGAGRDPATPAVVVENGALPQQRIVAGRLDGLADLIAREGVAGPAVILIGEAAQGALAQYGNAAADTESAA